MYEKIPTEELQDTERRAMQIKTTEILTAEKFADIYTDEEFRNQVAFAHWRAKSNGEKICQITCSYPVTWIVTPEQIAEAEAERIRAKRQTIKDNAGKLIFVGMGMTYEPRYEDDVCNYRVRTEFQNPEGVRFFIEFGTGGWLAPESLRIDFAINRTLEKQYEAAGSDKQGEYYNWRDLERKPPVLRYTKDNLRKIVNRYFDCHFSEVVIDNYNTSTDDFVSVSPSKGGAK